MALSQMTENRKAETHKSLIFRYPIFRFCLKKAPGRQRPKEWGSMQRTIMNMGAIASLCLMASCLTAQAQPPDATLKVHTVSIAVGAGYSWGGGIMTFQGQAYPCRVDGLAVGAVGSSSADAIGNVYNLTHIEDFSGHYLAVSAGALLAGGGDDAIL